MSAASTGRAVGVLAATRLDALVQELRTRGYLVHAMVLERGALVVRAIDGAERLPRGIVDEQGPGHYRLNEQGDRYFDHTVPADSWKRLFFPPRLRLWRARLGDGVIAPAPTEPARPLALLGVRGCDLAAILVQDRVFLGGTHPDPDYRARREGAFIVAVHCARPAPTCFCTAEETGPRANAGYDLGLTELADGRFLVEAATDVGAAVLAALPVASATAADAAEGAEISARAAAAVARRMPTDVARALAGARDSARWREIAERCLGCGSCTMVCPTCFCSAVEHTTDLAGGAAADRRWDTCFSAEHSYIHGGSVRRSTAARYRQWMTHKLSTWHDQFGTAGCTGCGRCITWCPVGIDITAEARAFTADVTEDHHGHDPGSAGTVADLRRTA